MPFSVDDDVLQLLATGCALAIGAIGLNIVTGYAGQVSLGHAFFVAIGAYTAAVLSGDPNGRVLGFGITEVPVWLLAAGAMSALAGALVAPLAVRLRGLYLAIVTLGLVFIGQYVFREWTEMAGPPDIGRPAPVATLFGTRIDVDGPSLTRVQQLYLLMLVLLVIFALLARNLARSRTGRAFAAIRDRDIAAAVIGVNLTRYKMIAFAVSSFYAGVAGALLYVIPQTFTAGNFNLLMSVQFIAMILIGGVGNDLRVDHGRAVHHAAAANHRRAAGRAAVHQHQRDRWRDHRRSGRVDPLRAADHRVPVLRAARLVRDLDPRPQLLEGLAVLVLSATGK